MRYLAFALALIVMAPVLAPSAIAQTNGGAGVTFDERVRLTSIDRSFRKKNYTTVYFGFDRDTLDADARARLKKQARLIRRHPDATFAVTGHADLVGDRGYNRALGLRRAQRVVGYLVALGVDRGDLRAMVSLGEDAPAVNVAHRERLNRRVTTRILFPWDDARQHALREAARTGAPAAAATGVVVTISTSESTTATVTDGSGASGTTGSVTTTGTTTGTTTTGGTAPAEELAKTTGKDRRPGNSASGTGRPDAGGGNGNEPSGDPAGSVGKNQGGDEPVL